MLSFSKYGLVFGLLALFAFNNYANAQSRDLMNRLNRLENEVQTLNDAYFRGKKPPSNYAPSTSGVSGSQAAQMEVRISALEQQLRTLTGRIEQNTFASRQLQNDLQRALQDMEIRLGDIERNRSGFSSNQNNYNITPNQAPVQAVVPTPTVQSGSYQVTPSSPQAQIVQPVPQQEAAALNTAANTKNLGAVGGNIANDPVTVYESAFSQLRSGEYGQAEAGFREFLSTFPDHNLASNAQYWLAETFYVRGNYEQAARGFAIGVQKYPEGTKSADNLLKLGLSLANSGKKGDACLTFGQLEEKHPNAPIPLKRRVSQEKARLGC